MKARPASRRASSQDSARHTTVLLGYLAGFASVVSFLWFFRHHEILLYGDAVAHINIARRVFDSRTPGLRQLGTVWLPLPHLLMIPFIVSDWAWESGFGASWPFMAAYVAGVLGIFRLVRDGLGGPGADWRAALAAWFAAVIFAANPNLVYTQATAMTETLYLAFFIWAVVLLAEFARCRYSDDAVHQGRAGAPLIGCGICLTLSMLTRYDGWFASAVFCAVLAVVLLRKPAAREGVKPLRRAVLIFAAIVVSAPALWLAYNRIIYGDPLDFARGPYSARGIELRTSAPGHATHPGDHNPVVAEIYFLKSAELNLADGPLGRVWPALAVAGTVVLLAWFRRLAIWLLLWIPLPFYALSIAYGGVPIFMPVWEPFSYYNVRYGLQLLPAFAVVVALLLYWALGRVAQPRRQAVVALLAFAFVAASYGLDWHATPVCLREARVNARTRVAFEEALAGYLRLLPASSTLLMYIGEHPGALEGAGVHLNRVIHEGNHGDPRRWGEEGMWKRALSDPGKYADFAIGFEDDQVTRSAQAHHLPALLVVHSMGQPTATIYGTHPPYPGLQ